MLLGQPFLKESIANGPWEWNVHDAIAMHMPDFRVSEAELTSCKAVRVDGNFGLGCHAFFELPYLLHECASHSLDA